MTKYDTKEYRDKWKDHRRAIRDAVDSLNGAMESAALDGFVVGMYIGHARPGYPTVEVLVDSPQDARSPSTGPDTPTDEQEAI